MTEQSQWDSNEEANAAILRGILDGVEEYVESSHGPELAGRLMQQIQEGRARLELEYTGWIVDEPSKFHLAFMALLVSSYQALLEALKLDKGKCIDLLKRVFVERNRESIQGYVEAGLDQAPDPMRSMVDIAKSRQKDFFGETFETEVIADNDAAHQVHYKTCFYYAYAQAAGVPELMSVLCEWDWNWAAGIVPEKHGFWFERPTTLGYGGDVCRFYFFRGGSPHKG